MPEDDLSVDDALATLREALRVAPSPALDARVRVRLAQARSANGRARRAWLVAAAATLAASAFWYGTRPERSEVDRTAPTATRARTEAAAPPAPATTPPAAPVTTAPRRAARAAPILVPPGGMARVARYVAGARSAPLDPRLVARDALAALPEPAALEVRAIDIAPLENEEGSPE